MIRWRVAAVAAVMLLGATTGAAVAWLRAGDPAPPPAGGATGPPPGAAATAHVPGVPTSRSASARPAPSTREAGWWRPRPGLTWQWQLSGRLDLSVPADVYDIDAVESSKSDVDALHAAGRRVICYVNAGAYEEWRPDAGRFPTGVLGRPLDGWPGERWLDVRRWDVLEPILAARFATCRAKGFDAVEPDNVDGYANDSGFPLGAADQLAFNRRLADLAHRTGLAIGLKNNVEQAAALEPAFDFAVNESCQVYRECDRLRVFVDRGKPVFHVEYGSGPCGFGELFSSLRKRPDLDAWREPC